MLYWGLMLGDRSYGRQNNSAIFWNLNPIFLIIFTLQWTFSASFCHRPFLIKIGRSGSNTRTTRSLWWFLTLEMADPGSFMLHLCLIGAEQGSHSASKQVVRGVSTKSWTSKIAPRSMDRSISRFASWGTGLLTSMLLWYQGSWKHRVWRVS